MKRLLQRLPSGYWLNHGLEEVRQQIAGIRLSDADLRILADEIARHLWRSRTGRTTNLLLLGLIVDEERFLKALRAKGALRPSKYGLNGRLIRACVAPLIDQADRVGLSEPSRRYLTSLFALTFVADQAREFQDHLRHVLRDGRTIKSLLVATDSLFLVGHEAQPGRFPGNAWQHHTKEALAEGFSIALYLHRSSGRSLSDAELGSPADPAALTDDTYRNLLAQCAVFRQYHEWEFEIDIGTHEARIADDTVFLRPADDRTEKATRLGYIQFEQSLVKAVIEETPGDAMTLAALAEQLHQALKQGGLLQIKDKPVRRLVLGLPAAMPKFLEIIGDDRFFAEEVAYLYHSGLSFLISPEDLTAFIVRGEVTVRDLMKAARIVNLIRQVLRLEIWELLATEPETAAQSLVPVFHRDQLLAFLSAAVDGKKAEELLGFWEWTGQGVFDLQYQPFVRADMHYAVPMNVFGDSNVIRNALQLARVRICHEEDPSERALANAFKARDVPTRHGVEYAYKGRDGEIDVLAVLDDIVFAFECKNSLLPTNPFELRQTLTYLEKANEQLDRLRLFWQDAEFVHMLQERTGLDLAPAMPLVTCAVTANRMLSGSIHGNHPVRALFELGSFLHRGGVGLLGQTVRVIQGTQVSGEDLRAYIESDSLHPESGVKTIRF